MTPVCQMLIGFLCSGEMWRRVSTETHSYQLLQFSLQIKQDSSSSSRVYSYHLLDADTTNNTVNTNTLNCLVYLLFVKVK